MKDCLERPSRRQTLITTRCTLLLALACLGLGGGAVRAASIVSPAQLDLDREVLPWDKPGSDLVGNAGDPDYLDFAGNTTFPADSLREALMNSPGYLMASHHAARRAPFLALLERKVTDGYKSCGFPEPRVTVSYDEKTGRVKVQIVEGKRFMCGEVKVSGVSKTVASGVVERLTKPSPDGTDNNSSPTGDRSGTRTEEKKAGDGVSVKTTAYMELTPAKAENPLTPGRKPRKERFVWQPGKPAGFCEAAWRDLEFDTKEVLAENGFFFAKVSLHPKLVPETGLADLMVEVTELGPPGVLSTIEVSGNEKNSASEIKQFLGLKPGMKITRALLEAAEQKLWDSGRFRYYELKPEPDPGAGPASPQTRLQISVVEFDFAPKLTDTLSRSQQALLRLCDWLSDFASRPEQDAVFSVSSQDVPLPLDIEAALSPTRGALLQFKGPAFKAPGYAYSFLFATNTLGLFAPQRGSKLLAVKSNILVEIHFRIVPLPPGSDQRFNLTFAAGWRMVPPEEAATRPPLGLDFLLAPAAFLSLADTLGDDITFDGNTCSVVTSNLVMKFDAETGRVGEMRFDNGPAVGHLSFVTNGFTRALANLNASSASLTNQFSGERPFSSLVSFVGGELARLAFLDRAVTNLTATERAQAVGALCRLLDAPVLAPIDRKVKEQASQPLTEFSVPPDEVDVALGRNNIFALFSGIVFRHCNEWFPKYSWPWTMARESVLLLGSQGAYIDAELTRLINSESTGPLGCLALSAGLSRMGSPAAKEFATRGLTRLGAAGFKADYRLLFEGDTGLVKTVANMAEVLRTLPPEQLAALVKTLPPTEAKFVRECAQALQAQPKAPLPAVLGPALDQYWEQSLRSQVRAKLLDLANRRPKGVSS